MGATLNCDSPASKLGIIVVIDRRLVTDDAVPPLLWSAKSPTGTLQLRPKRDRPIRCRDEVIEIRIVCSAVYMWGMLVRLCSDRET